MANGKSQITDIDIENVSVNLTDYLEDIKPYEGFIQCNSPYIGGLLNNVYKRNIQLPNGHKLVRMHNGNMYTIVGGTLYKNGIEIANVSTKLLYFGDTYKVEYDENVDELLVLMIVLAMDIFHAPSKKDDFKETLDYKLWHW